MGDRITSWKDCPRCGAQGEFECYEALSSNMKYDECLKCDYRINYIFTEADGVVEITAQPSEQLTAKPQASHPKPISEFIDEWFVRHDVGVSCSDIRCATESRHLDCTLKAKQKLVTRIEEEIEAAHALYPDKEEYVPKRRLEEEVTAARVEIADWAVHFVDKIELDKPAPDDMWRTFKFIRNGMRDEFKRVYGIDPSPKHDPTKAALQHKDSAVTLEDNNKDSVTAASPSKVQVESKSREEDING